MQDGLLNGTLNWDVLLMKVLSLALQAALGALAGHVRSSRLYTGMECSVAGH